MLEGGQCGAGDLVVVAHRAERGDSKEEEIERDNGTEGFKLGDGASVPEPPPFLTVLSFPALPPFLSSFIAVLFNYKSIKYYIHLNIKSEYPSLYPIP